MGETYESLDAFNETDDESNDSFVESNDSLNRQDRASLSHVPRYTRRISASFASTADAPDSAISPVCST